MKTKVLAALVATMAVGATCAFAANPFVDVPSDSWAYKSVVELADAGIVQGVDGTYFQGERNITRYEAAEMTAKAMAHMDKASVEQRALINKLADEFADELNSLGVRVSNLEKKVGNVKLSGDARVRYRYQSDNKENDSSWDYRVRLRAKANVNDRTKVSYGISTNNHSFADNGSASGADEQDGNDTFTDRALVNYNFGGNNWDLQVGRTNNYTIGGPNAYGWLYGDIFDGAQLTYKNDHFRATAGYGKFKEGKNATIEGKKYASKNAFVGAKLGDDYDSVKTGYGELEAFFNNGSAVGVFYNSFNRTGNGKLDEQVVDDADNLWGAYASLNFGKNWNLLGEFNHVKKDNVKAGQDDSANVWVGRLKYGKASMAAPKSWDLWVEYLNVEDGAWIGGSTNSWRFDVGDNFTSWGVGGDYVFAKNAKFSVYQSFASKLKDDKAGISDPEEQTRAEFVFAF